MTFLTPVGLLNHLFHASEQKSYLKGSQEKIAYHEKQGIGLRSGFVGVNKNKNENTSSDELEHYGKQVILNEILMPGLLHEEKHQPRGN
jgi:hypothetical protein